jgi:hypothetical protein
MSALHDLRLPASELAKLRPSHPPDRAPGGRPARAPSVPDALPAAPSRRPRPAHHLSGFARA